MGDLGGQSPPLKDTGGQSPPLKDTGGQSPPLKDLGGRPRWNTANPKYYKNLKDEVKRLKSEMTEAEAILWQELKSKKLGVKFRRQHMIDKFIPDFVSLSIKLIVEVDGGIHKTQQEYDEGRTFELSELGYKVIRFLNEEVISDVSEVVRKIKSEINLLRSQVPPLEGFREVSSPPLGE